ncbi:tRNA (adenosine(37)-N6)-threonylcarbamoyltransferase complex ATPase subunit type 1 TsaE [Jejudonia soesokkakensis]|uniref:tRNA threonylcarbamoyladenosine biosynthesis protein TsaE n=1 Tax=Jejudonia soesokkakensis TaxID=1323432 RepID=A0ABW2MSL7_9FLAO
MTVTYKIEHLPEVAEQLLAANKNKNILFYGEMGVGKTTLIKEVAKSLGVLDTISSPTFSIVNEYALPEGKLFHFDFYRIEDEEEAMDIGVEEYFSSGHWNFIEWPDHIATLLPDTYTKVTLVKNHNGTRTLNVLPVN